MRRAKALDILWRPFRVPAIEATVVSTIRSKRRAYLDGNVFLTVTNLERACNEAVAAMFRGSATQRTRNPPVLLSQSRANGDSGVHDAVGLPAALGFRYMARDLAQGGDRLPPIQTLLRGPPTNTKIQIQMAVRAPSTVGRLK